MIIGICKYCKKEFRKRENKRIFCSLFCSNNFNKNCLTKVNLPSYSIDLAEFVGICLGDGYVSKYQVFVTLNSIVDHEYIPYVMNLIQKLFPKVGMSLVKRKDNATDVRINSSIVASFLSSMGIIPNKKIIPAWIFTNESYKKVCVRGLFDTEGSISFKVYEAKAGRSLYKQLNFRNTDTKLIKFVRDTLFALHLKPTMTLKNSLYISNHLDIDKVREIIGFSNPKLQKRSQVYAYSEYLSLL